MAKSPPTSTNAHYGVIIIGAGVSGIAASIQLKRKLGFTDVMIYERNSDIGGTWWNNTYPGAACDVPFSLYSFSFAPTSDCQSQWAGQQDIVDYLHRVQKEHSVHNITFRTSVTEARWSSDTGLWTVKMQNIDTNETLIKTCNVLISAAGGLVDPSIPPFVSKEFKGDVFHSARWDHSVDLTDKNVVVVGNGCSAAQIVPEIVEQTRSLTQVARSRQAVIKRPALPDGSLFWLLARYVPGLLWLVRALVFCLMESNFTMMDIEKGKKMRGQTVKAMTDYIHEAAPEKYWDKLMPDFEVAAKRRIFDKNYYQSMHSDKFTLIADDSVVAMKSNSVVTAGGQEIPADVVVLCTGFAVQDFIFGARIFNAKDESLQHRLKTSGARTFEGMSFRSSIHPARTCVSDFPNFFMLMGPNTVTGHTSVIFTTECQITMVLNLVSPILKKLKSTSTVSPAPSVVVTHEAEQSFNAALRAEMKKKVWEKDGGVSWYVDKETGICTTLYPWSQVSFWWSTLWPKTAEFKRIGC